MTVDTGNGNDGGAPEDGGGEAELDTSLYPGIDNVPQEYRQHIDPILREVTKNANTKFEDYNNQLKTWEPYKDYNIPEKIDPDTMGGLIGLYDAIIAAENGEKDQFSEWWDKVGNDFELFDTEGAEEELEEENPQATPEQIAELVKQGVAEQMAPFQQQRQQEMEQAELNEANENIDKELEPIKQQLGDKYTPEIEKAILKLGLGYDKESVKHGFMEWKQIVENAEGNVFTQVEAQPAKPEGPGIPNTSPEKITNFKDAEALANDYLAKQAAAQ